MTLRSRPGRANLVVGWYKFLAFIVTLMGAVALIKWWIWRG
jgi:hypothetical protein